MKKTHAFTLVEIMIVVAILGLLAAIAIPSFARAKRTHELNEKGLLLPGETYDQALDQKGFYDNRMKSLAGHEELGTNETLVGISTTPSARFVKTVYNDGWFILRDIQTGSQWVGWEDQMKPQFMSPFTSTKPIKPEADEK